MTPGNEHRPSPPSQDRPQENKIILSRELGDQERYLHGLHLFGGLIGTTILDIEGPLDEPLVRRALDWLQGRHPILQAHIKFRGFGRTNSFPWFFRQPYFITRDTKPIPLRVAIIADEVALDELVHAEFQKPIKSANSPRMRAILALNCYRNGHHKLILAADHAVVDAQAIAKTVSDLMDFFADASSHVTDAPRRGLPPSMESRLSKKTGDTKKPYQPAIRIPIKYSPFKPRHTLTLAHHFTLDQTDTIKAKLAQNRTTMHGLLAASMLKTLGDKYALEQMTCLSSVEFRRMCTPPIPDDAYGCYIDTLRTKHRLNKTTWELARDVSFRLISTLVHDQAAASLLKMPSLQQMRLETLPMIKSGMRLDSLAITTAGEFKVSHTYGAFKLHDILLSMSLNKVGASILIMSFEREGALTINMCHTTPDLSPPEARELLNTAINHALSAADAVSD